MDILLVSNEDTCRSRLAQALLESFGRGMKFTTAGVVAGRVVPESLIQILDEHGLALSHRAPVDLDEMADRSWDCIVTLCPEAEQHVRELQLKSRFYHSFSFSPLVSVESEDEVTELHETMWRELYRFYRDTISDLVMPMCTCGANTYCRCE